MSIAISVLLLAGAATPAEPCVQITRWVGFEPGAARALGKQLSGWWAEDGLTGQVTTEPCAGGATAELQLIRIGSSVRVTLQPAGGAPVIEWNEATDAFPGPVTRERLAPFGRASEPATAETAPVTPSATAQATAPPARRIGAVEIGLWGLSAAALGVGVSFGIIALDEKKKVDAGNAGSQKADERGRRAALVANVSFAISAAALAGGLLTYFLSEPVAEVGVAPTEGGGSVSLGWQF